MCTHAVNPCVLAFLFYFAQRCVRGKRTQKQNKLPIDVFVQIAASSDAAQLVFPPRLKRRTGSRLRTKHATVAIALDIGDSNGEGDRQTTDALRCTENKNWWSNPCYAYKWSLNHDRRVETFEEPVPTRSVAPRYRTFGHLEGTWRHLAPPRQFFRERLRNLRRQDARGPPD